MSIDNTSAFMCIYFSYLLFCCFVAYYVGGIALSLVKFFLAPVFWYFQNYISFAKKIINIWNNEVLLVGIVLGIILFLYLQGKLRKQEKLPFKPTFYYNEDCPVCQQTLDQQFDEMEVLPCDHGFHTDCLSIWVMTFNSSSVYKKLSQCGPTCPICRAPLLANNQLNCTAGY